MNVNFLDVRKGSLFIARNHQRCTVISRELMAAEFSMPVFKVVFVTSAGAKFQAMYYQNGAMLDSAYNCWDAVSVIVPLQIPENLKRPRSDSEPIFKRHRECK
jgi:hypothetical protein